MSKIKSTIKVMCTIFMLVALVTCFGCSTTANITVTNTNENKTAEPTVPVNVIDKTEVTADGEFLVQFIDVGQADAALVSCDGHYMLVDGGNAGDSDVIYTVLEKNNITKLDVVVASHMHEDHIGGLPAAFEHGEVGTFYENGSVKDTKIYAKVMAAADNGVTEIVVPKQGDSFDLGSAVCTFVSTGNVYDDENDNSLVLKVVYGETSFLFTGDASADAEADMVASGVDLNADVLKVGHHGSDTATGYVFLREVMPSVSVISVGEANKYGHPTDEVLSRLRDEGCNLYRTDLSGDVFVTSNGVEVSVETQREAASNPFAVQ